MEVSRAERKRDKERDGMGGKERAYLWERTRAMERKGGGKEFRGMKGKRAKVF